MKPMITACPTCGYDEFDTFDNYCTKCVTDLRPYRIACGGCKTAFLVHIEIDHCPYCGSAELKPVDQVI